MDKCINILGIRIDNITSKETLNKIENFIIIRKPVQIVGGNVDQVLKVNENKYSKKIFNEAALVFTDGKPIVWISRILGTPIRERITGPDLMLKLCEVAAIKKYKIFLLGSAPGVAAKAAENLKNKYKNLQVVGTYSPPFGFEKDAEELQKINKMLLDSMADILFVGMGSPKQDIFIYENKNQYKIPVSFSMGAAIDFIGGSVKRAPRWMINIGLEWFYRVLQDPQRLFKRYFIDDMKIISILINDLKRKKKKR